MLVPPLKRERTESGRGHLNIRVSITEFYCDRPAGCRAFHCGEQKRKPHLAEADLLSMGLRGYMPLIFTRVGIPSSQLPLFRSAMGPDCVKT
jgi:hypothetical protein